MKISIVLIISVFTFCNLNAQVLKLEDAISFALANNHGVQVSKQMTEFTKLGIHAGAVGFLPTVDASAVGSYNYSLTDQEFNLASIPPTKNQEAAQNNQSTKVSAYYLIFNGGARLRSFDKLKASGELSEMQTKITIESTLIEVINRYYEVVRLSKKTDLIKVSMDISKDRLTRIVTNYEFGNVGKIEMFNAQVDYNNDSSNYVNSQLTRRTAMNELNYLLGRTISTNFEVETELDMPQVFAVDNYIQKAKSNNTSIMLSNIELEMVELDRKISSSNFMPTLTTNIDYGYVGSASDIGIFKSNSSLGYTGALSLKWNLFDGMKKRKILEQAKVNRAVNNTKQQQTLLSIEKEVQNYHDALSINIQLIELEKKNLEVAVLNLSRSKELYQNGSINNIQFRQAQLNLLQTQNKINNYKYVCKVFEYQLLRMTNELVK